MNHYMLRISLILWYCVLLMRARNVSMENSCSTVSSLLKAQADACRCFPAGVGSGGLHLTSTSEDMDDQSSAFDSAPWIGCSRERMPAIYRSLAALPENMYIQKLWIWDSIIPVVPQKFFGSIKIKHLILESSHVGQFFTGIFKPFAGHLRVLILKSNIIYRIDAGLFAGLERLRVLDLSGNQLSQIGSASFGNNMPKLKTLNLNHNNISLIREGAFRHLNELETLSMAFNALSTLEMDSLSGLNNLQHLDLERNRLDIIPTGVFDHLLHLKTLNLGHNCLKTIQLLTLPSLVTLLLHNNSFAKIEDISVHSPFASLESLYLDQNMISSLESDQFSGFPALRQLSLTSNRLYYIHVNAFRRSPTLWSLSLQRNQLSQLLPGVFGPLGNLSRLILSENNLTSLDENTLSGLDSLRLLSVSHNKLRRIDPSTFAGLKKLQKLYINDNELQQLENETLSQLSDALFLLDLSDNPWQCDCKALWLVEWLQQQDHVLVNTLHTRCAENAAPVGTVADELAWHCLHGNNDSSTGTFNGQRTNDLWISALSIVLAVLSLLILAAIAVMYIQDGMLLRQYAELRRTPSDMVNLISSSK